MKDRYNIFNQIHKGLRAMLYDTAMALQHNDFAVIEETESVFEKLNEVLAVLRDHAVHENHFILPAINKFNAELVAEFEQEHHVDESLADGLRNLMIAYSRAVSDDAKREAGESISKAFNEFIAFSLYHMSKEENKLNKVLWAHYTDPEISGLQNAIIAAITPKLMLVEASWMMRGINNHEIVQWLKCVKNGACVKDGAPDHVFQTLLGIAENELPAERWHKILEELCEGSMVA